MREWKGSAPCLLNRDSNMNIHAFTAWQLRQESTLRYVFECFGYTCHTGKGAGYHGNPSKAA